MKVIVNLTSGQKIEREVVTAFSAGTLTYVVLDAAAVGNGGMPIVLVSKLVDGALAKMTDASEWQSAKENLKAIIAGNVMNYINIPGELKGEDVYYTQLTIPVPSFDLIKGAYKPQVIEEPTPVAEPIAVNMEAPVVETPVVEPTPIAVEPVVLNQEPVVETPTVIEPVVNMETPVVEEPAVINPIPSATEVASISLNNVEPQVTPISDIMPPVESTPVVAENPVDEPAPIVETPVVDNVPAETISAVDFNETKEMFMKACETMFDALVTKFQAELDKK